MIHLDTSFLIRALASGGAEDRLLRGWIRDGQSLAMSAVAWAEFLCGPVDAPIAEIAARLVSDLCPFTAIDATLAAKLYNAAGRRRGSLLDCMIAATAVNAGAGLATSNPSDFRRFEPEGPDILSP